MPTLLEMVAVVFSFAAVWLTIRKHVACWPVGLVGVTAYFLLFHRLRLYADMALQVVFFAQGLYGWWFWRRGGTDRREPPVTLLGLPRLAVLAASVLLATLGIGALLARTDASAPYLDSFLALTSLAANALLARKVLESWWLWITADVLYIGLFLTRGVPLSAALYLVFLLMAIQGAVRWQRELGTTPGVAGEGAA
jgi:nicotinamide mononucleotide transporter